MFDYRFFEGVRIYLAPLQPDDYKLLIKWMNHEATRLLGRGRTDVINEDNAKRIVERLIKDDQAFIIYLKDDHRPLGYALLTDRDEYNRSAEIGITIGEDEARGKGYGAETVKFLLKHGFVNLNLESISLAVFEYNTPALKLYEKVGFKMVGKRRNAKIIGNQKFGEIIMDMVAEEYFASYGSTFLPSF